MLVIVALQCVTHRTDSVKRRKRAQDRTGESQPPGIGDLGKTVFQLVAFNLRGEVVVRKKFSRTQPLHFSAKVHVQLASKPAGMRIFLAGLCENRPVDGTRFQYR